MLVKKWTMKGKFKIKIIVFLSICMSTGCGNNKKLDFYCDAVRDNEVWRIPITEPFELITVDSSSFWNLYCFRTNNCFDSDYSVDSITYHQKQILFFNESGDMVNFGLVDTETGKVTDFKNRSTFMEFRSMDTAWQNLYSVKDLFRQFYKKRILPWGNEITNLKPCK